MMAECVNDLMMCLIKDATFTRRGLSQVMFREQAGAARSLACEKASPNLERGSTEFAARIKVGDRAWSRWLARRYRYRACGKILSPKNVVYRINPH